MTPATVAIIARVRAAATEEYTDRAASAQEGGTYEPPPQIYADALALADALEEFDDMTALVRGQGDLLTGAVNALRGPPPEGAFWSHHDVAELAAAAKARITALERVLREIEERPRGYVSENPILRVALQMSEMATAALAGAAAPLHTEPIVDDHGYVRGHRLIAGDNEPRYWDPPVEQKP